MLQANIPELTDSSDIAADPKKLKQRFDKDGYIFVRNMLDEELIEWARTQYCEKLAEDDLVEPGDTSAKWTGAQKRREEPCDTLGTTVWSEIVAQESLNYLSKAVLQEDLVWIPIIRHRCSLPSGPELAGEDIFFNRHQDSYFNEGLDFAICWLPMMDIPRRRGGLTIAAGLHQSGDFHEPTPPFPIPEGRIPENSWRTADYRPGDILIFHKAIPHAGLRNQSDHIRLSMDLRVIGKSSQQPIVGHVASVGHNALTLVNDDGEHRIHVDEATFIRDIVSKRYSADELDKVAAVGAKILAVTNSSNLASLVRPIKY